MKRAATAVLCIALLNAGCKQEVEPVEVEAIGVPATARDLDVKVVKPGSGQLESVDASTAKGIKLALDAVLTGPAEQASAADKASAKDPAKLLGDWQIKHTLYSTNGKVNRSTPPLAPTKWRFGKDGKLSIDGGMKIDARYTFTGDRLLITGFGPKQTYYIGKLTDKALEVTVRIGAGTTIIENTTVLERL